MSYFWLHCANLWTLLSFLSLCLSQYHFDCLLSIHLFHFFQLNLTLLLSPCLWICSVPTFANLPLVGSALSVCCLDPHHMTVCHVLPSAT